MTESSPKTYTAFLGLRQVAAGPMAEVALAVGRAALLDPTGPLLIFDDATGAVVDLDVRTSYPEPDQQTLSEAEPNPDGETAPRGRGRPKLGVIAREVTLLPRQWDWLNSQPGGASVALRRLVDAARKASGAADRRRAAQSSAYSFMSAMAGDLPGFEEAARALFADDRRAFALQAAAWPEDVRDHAVKLAFLDREILD